MFEAVLEACGGVGKVQLTEKVVKRFKIRFMTC